MHRENILRELKLEISVFKLQVWAKGFQAETFEEDLDFQKRVPTAAAS